MYDYWKTLAGTGTSYSRDGLLVRALATKGIGLENRNKIELNGSGCILSLPLQPGRVYKVKFDFCAWGYDESISVSFGVVQRRPHQPILDFETSPRLARVFDTRYRCSDRLTLTFDTASLRLAIDSGPPQILVAQGNYPWHFIARVVVGRNYREGHIQQTCLT